MAQSNGSDHNAEEGDPPWYMDSKFDRYWSHYRQMKDWMRAQTSRSHPLQQQCQDSMASAWLQSYQQYYLQYHQWLTHYSAVQACQYSQSQYSSQRPYTWYKQDSSRRSKSFPHEQHHHHHHSHHHPYGHHRPAAYAYRGTTQYVTDQSDVDYLDNGFSESQYEDEEEDIRYHHGDEEEEEEEFEVELSEEMRQFFLQSQKHREELMEMRRELEAKQNRRKSHEEDDGEEERTGESFDEFVVSSAKDANKKKKRRDLLGAPSEQPGKRRADEMKVLYGKDSPAIHGMETAIQMQFDRNCDKKQPSFWPTVPLKM